MTGEEIDRLEFEVSEVLGMILQLQKDRLTLALRVMGEDVDTLSPECIEVMQRIMPEIEAKLRGE
jgi:hypothetical protein